VIADASKMNSGFMAVTTAEPQGREENAQKVCRVPPAFRGVPPTRRVDEPRHSQGD
jgi:hypothetical protein